MSVYLTGKTLPKHVRSALANQFSQCGYAFMFLTTSDRPSLRRKHWQHNGYTDSGHTGQTTLSGNESAGENVGNG